MPRPPPPPLGWWLWTLAVAVTAMVTAMVAADPVVGPARPRLKAHASEARYGTNVVSGKLAKSKSFPYQVYLRVFLRNGSVDFCGGAIVGVRHVLSAAHCVDKPNVVKKMAVIGSEHRFGRKALNFSIIRQTYYPRKPFENVDGDIVILMVDRPMPLGLENVKFVKIQTRRLFNRHAICTVAGWGDSRDNLDPNLLKFVRVPLVSRRQCRTSYPLDPPNDLLCAGFYEEGGADTCQGDSGGPLVCSGRLTGIVKGGVGCGLAHYPGTYTDVSYYWSWVRKVMMADWKRYFKNETSSPFRRKWRLSPRNNRQQNQGINRG